MSTTINIKTIKLATMSGVQEALGYLTARAAVSARRERALVDHLQAGIALVDGDPRAGEELLAWAMRAQTLIAVTHQAYQRQPVPAPGAGR